jgi:23S rRNA pseudouridine1911/1915/1917 synthase
MSNGSSEQNNGALLTVDSSGTGKRLDAFLAEHIEGWSRSQLQKLIENGDVLVNERAAKASYKLRPGDEIDLDLTEPPAARFEPEDIPLEIVFEDEYLAVINKPAGMIVHPGAGVPSGTLANAIAWHFQSVPPAVAGGDLTPSKTAPPATAGGTDSAHRVGIVHRLDKDTSGLILVAKNEQIQEKLAEQFRRRQVFKSYVALVHGSPRENSGTIDRPIARDRWHRTKMTVAANGRQAISHWRVRQRFEKFTLLEVEIKTGRTHQIRVHMASINHPVVGDATYNEGRDNNVADLHVRKAIASLGRFFLHAEKLSFTHPATMQRMEFESKMPVELTEILGLL